MMNPHMVDGDEVGLFPVYGPDEVDAGRGDRESASGNNNCVLIEMCCGSRAFSPAPPRPGDRSTLLITMRIRNETPAL